MGISEFVFYLFAATAVVSAVYILFTKNVVYAAFALVVTLLSVAGIYIFARAEFVAMTQLVIYVGGIVVLIVFGVMLTHEKSEKPYVSGSHFRLIGLLVSATIFIFLVYAILEMNLNFIRQADQVGGLTNTERLGVGIMSEYLLLFEVAAVVLLIALIGAASIAGFKTIKK